MILKTERVLFLCVLGRLVFIINEKKGGKIRGGKEKMEFKEATKQEE